MVCLNCGHDTQVINSRPQKRTNQVWRRRQCVNCGLIFTTEEKTDYSGLWAVRDPRGRLQPFSRDKLLLSLHQSCAHRPRALEDAAGLTDTVINKLRGQVDQGILSRAIIIRAVQVSLNRFDKAASTHYTAFHTPSAR